MRIACCLHFKVLLRLAELLLVPDLGTSRRCSSGMVVVGANG